MRTPLLVTLLLAGSCGTPTRSVRGAGPVLSIPTRDVDLDVSSRLAQTATVTARRQGYARFGLRLQARLEEGGGPKRVWLEHGGRRIEPSERAGRILRVSPLAARDHQDGRTVYRTTEGRASRTTMWLSPPDIYETELEVAFADPSLPPGGPVTLVVADGVELRYTFL